MKKKEIELRVRAEAEYMLENQATTRMCAKEFNVSVGTIHTDLTERLKEIDYDAYIKVRELIEKNAKESFKRGSDARTESFKKKRRSM